MKCPKCAAENEDSALFCFNCGFKMELQVEPPVNNVEPPVNNVEPPVYKVEPPVKKGPSTLKFKPSKKLIMGVGGALILVMVVASVFIKSNPAMRLGYGFGKLMSKNQISVTLSAKTDIDKDVDELFEMINFESRLHINANKNEVFMTVAASHKKNDLIVGSVFLDEKAMFFDMPEVFGKNEFYYFDYYDYLDLDEEIDFNKYVKMIDWHRFPKKAFLKVMGETINDNADNGFSSTVIELRGKDLVNMMDGILEAAEDDEDVAIWLQKNMSKVLKAMIKDDVDFDMAYMDLEDLLDVVEDDDFVDGYADLVEEMNDSFSDEKSYMLESMRDFTVTLDVKYSLLNRIKNVDMTMDVDSEAMTVMMSFTDNNKPKTNYTTKNGNDILDLDQDEIYDLVWDSYDVLLDNISDEEELEDYLNDLSEDNGYEDYEDWLYYIIDDMTYYMYY